MPEPVGPSLRPIAVAGVDAIHEPENAALVRPLARVDEGASSLSLTWVELDGRHRRVRSARATRVYFVLDGEFVFQVSGEVAHTVRRNECIVVPRDRAYALEGKGTYLVLNTPAFTPGDDLYEE